LLLSRVKEGRERVFRVKTIAYASGEMHECPPMEDIEPNEIASTALENTKRWYKAVSTRPSTAA